MGKCRMTCVHLIGFAVEFMIICRLAGSSSLLGYQTHEIDTRELNLSIGGASPSKYKGPISSGLYYSRRRS
jgi:hypothetical protein